MEQWHRAWHSTQGNVRRPRDSTVERGHGTHWEAGRSADENAGALGRSWSTERIGARRNVAHLFGRNVAARTSLGGEATSLNPSNTDRQLTKSIEPTSPGRTQRYSSRATLDSYASAKRDPGRNRTSPSTSIGERARRVITSSRACGAVSSCSASMNPMPLRAYSRTVCWKPPHVPRNGTLCSRANRIAEGSAHVRVRAGGDRPHAARPSLLLSERRAEDPGCSNGATVATRVGLPRLAPALR
jgi:hypothetical protein